VAAPPTRGGRGGSKNRSWYYHSLRLGRGQSSHAYRRALLSRAGGSSVAWSCRQRRRSGREPRRAQGLLMWCAARPARVATLWLCRVQTAYPLISPLQPARVSSLYTFPGSLVAYARALEVSSQRPLPRATHLSLRPVACFLLTYCSPPLPCFLSSAPGAHREGETPRRSAHRRLLRTLLPKRCRFMGRRQRGPERQRLACVLPSLGSSSAYPSSLCSARRASEGGKRSSDRCIVAFVVCSFQKGTGSWVHGEAVRRYSRTRVSSECVCAVHT
jgi:hypothetical protein